MCRFSRKRGRAPWQRSRACRGEHASSPAGPRRRTKEWGRFSFPLLSHEWFSFPWSAERALHLHGNETVQLDRVFQGERFGYRLHESLYDQIDGLLLGQAAAHQIEDLLLGDAPHLGFVTERDVI